MGRGVLAHGHASAGGVVEGVLDEVEGFLAGSGDEFVEIDADLVGEVVTCVSQRVPSFLAIL